MGLKLNLNVAQPSNNKDSYDMKQFERQIVPIDELLCWCSETQASDLYIKEYEAPYISRFGQVVRLPCRPTSRDVWRSFYGKYVQEELNAKYRRNKMLDVSVQIRIPEDSKFYGKTESNFFRYRASLGFSENHDIATFRMINPEPPTFDTINYPTQCKEALEKAFSSRLGINIFSGPVGSGKTTSQAAVLNTFTREGGILDNKVIISLEDPIEYEFASTESVKFSQKELDKDFISFASGIKQSLREHSNLIIIGECRDKEVISAACEAARSGHIVTTSFHAGTVGGTVSRMLFHLDNNKDLTYDLILNLNIIMAQTLIKQESSYLVDTQYLLFNDMIKKRVLAAFNNNENIQMIVDSLVKDKELQEKKLAKDWNYHDLQTL